MRGRLVLTARAPLGCPSGRRTSTADACPGRAGDRSTPALPAPDGRPGVLRWLSIALPGLLTLAGHAMCGLPGIHARLAADLEGRERDWTRFFFGRLTEEDGLPVFHPLHGSSRLRDMAEAEAIVCIPEGEECLLKGSVITVQVLK